MNETVRLRLCVSQYRRLREVRPVRSNSAWDIRQSVAAALFALCFAGIARAAQPVSEPAPALAPTPAQATERAPAVSAELEALSQPRSSEAFQAAVKKIGEMPVADPVYLKPLMEASAGAPALEKPPILLAISSIRTRAATEYLVSLLGVTGADAAEHASVVAALGRATGREDLGDNVASWRKFLESVPDESAWQKQLLENVSSRADRESKELQVSQARLLEALRSLHLATPAEKRWALIGSLLTDSLSSVNLLGLELLSRELSAGNRPLAEVGPKVLALLKSADPAIREQAAIVTGNIAPAGSDIAIRQALEKETVPKVAAALLSAIAHWPSNESEAIVLRWMNGTPNPTGDAKTARDGALDAAWAFWRAGYLRSDEATDRTLQIVRAINPAQLSGAGVHLRAELGDQADRDAIVLLLGSSQPAQRLATGESLVPYPEYLPRILAAAREDPLLIDVAVRGVLAIDPSVAGFVAIEEATRKIPDQRRTALTVVASVLSEVELLEASRKLAAEPVLREAVLAEIAAPPRIMSERTDPTGLPQVAADLYELAELRLELARYADAIAALDALPEMDSLLPPDKLRNLRATALVCLDRADQARQLGAKPEAWLKALELSLAQANAAQVASAVETGMGDKFSPEQRQKMESLKARIAQR